MSQHCKMSNLISNSVFLVIIALWPTQLVWSQETKGHVSGKISDADTDLPIAGAQLTFIADPNYATTNANGSYTAMLPEGTYTVYITKDGYANNSLHDVQVVPTDITEQDAVLTTNIIYPWPFITAPTSFRTFQDRLRFYPQSFNGYGYYWPDGKAIAFRSDPCDKTSPFIVHITPDYRLTSPNSFFNNISGPAGSRVADYPNHNATQHSNWVALPNTIPIPPKEVTGLRGDGTHYDDSDAWLMNALRLSETSDPEADPDQMIGFVHNEDYWGNPYAYSGCTYKSVGVRYSNDLGKSWTRSVPILTKQIQHETWAECVNQTAGIPAAGTGDMAAVWNHLTKQWVIYAQEGQFLGIYSPPPALVMSVSSDALGRPGTWTRIDPTTNRTDPGFIGSTNRTLVHGDLKNIPGCNPSIIRDTKNNVWHIVYSHWGGGMAYANSTDLMRWTKAMYLPVINSTSQGYGYPTLIGDEGDALTTTGKAWLWFKGNFRDDGDGYNSIYGAELDFGSTRE